jgi:hypothetical protein
MPGCLDIPSVGSRSVPRGISTGPAVTSPSFTGTWTGVAPPGVTAPAGVKFASETSYYGGGGLAVKF